MGRQVTFWRSKVFWNKNVNMSFWELFCNLLKCYFTCSRTQCSQRIEWPHRIKIEVVAIKHMLHLVTELKWANIDVGVKEFLYRGGLNYTLDTMTAKYRIMITFVAWEVYMYTLCIKYNPTKVFQDLTWCMSQI